MDCCVRVVSVILLRTSLVLVNFCVTALTDEFGAEGKDADEFEDAEGDGWGDEDDLELEVGPAFC